MKKKTGKNLVASRYDENVMKENTTLNHFTPQMYVVEVNAIQ